MFGEDIIKIVESVLTGEPPEHICTCMILKCKKV